MDGQRNHAAVERLTQQRRAKLRGGVHHELPRHPHAGLGELSHPRLERFDRLGKHHELAAFNHLFGAQLRRPRQQRLDAIGGGRIRYRHTDQRVAGGGQARCKHRAEQVVSDHSNAESTVSICAHRCPSCR